MRSPPAAAAHSLRQLSLLRVNGVPRLSPAEVLTYYVNEDSERPWAPKPRKRSSKVLSEQALASAKRIVSAAPKRQRRRGVVVLSACIVKFVPTTLADFESTSEYEEHLDYVQQLRSD